MASASTAGPQTGWLRGTIKEVPSGDTVTIVGPTKGGPPPEKRITLSSLLAPRLVGVPVSIAVAYLPDV